MKILETERLILRNFELEDIQGAHKLFTDDDAMRYVGMYPAFTTIEETKNRVEQWRQNDERIAIAIKATGEFVGYISVNPDSEEGREDTREFGFAISAEYRRKGYMREAVNAILEQLRDEGIIYVWACCFKGNSSSEALIRSLGFEFQQEGTFHSQNDRTYESLEFRLTLQ
jgi:ribosomal-protein-alanine N-acetyltransferase